ncbi:MAG: hypothetical protein FJZ38_05075 [Candidatus Rokubacteria bacterium]|nr:hypothetical protein [Candidatus Rokubacteria bacterium]
MTPPRADAIAAAAGRAAAGSGASTERERSVMIGIVTGGAQLPVSLVAAVVGTAGSVWLWRRNHAIALRAASPVMDAQWRLYRSKTVTNGTVAVSVGSTSLWVNDSSSEISAR